MCVKGNNDFTLDFEFNVHDFIFNIIQSLQGITLDFFTEDVMTKGLPGMEYTPEEISRLEELKSSIQNPQPSTGRFKETLPETKNWAMQPVQSSLVKGAGVYKGMLVLEFHHSPGSFWGYKLNDAEGFFQDLMASGSKGGWVWDKLLGRPSKYGMAQGSFFAVPGPTETKFFTSKGAKFVHKLGRPIEFTVNPLGYGGGFDEQSYNATSELWKEMKMKGYTEPTEFGVQEWQGLETSINPWELPRVSGTFVPPEPESEEEPTQTEEEEEPEPEPDRWAFGRRQRGRGRPKHQGRTRKNYYRKRGRDFIVDGFEIKLIHDHETRHNETSSLNTIPSDAEAVLSTDDADDEGHDIQDNGKSAKTGKADLLTEDDEDGKWITIKGRHIFIKEGQSINESLKETSEKKEIDIEKGQNKKIEKWKIELKGKTFREKVNYLDNEMEGMLSSTLDDKGLDLKAIKKFSYGYISPEFLSHNEHDRTHNFEDINDYIADIPPIIRIKDEITGELIGNDGNHRINACYYHRKNVPTLTIIIKKNQNDMLTEDDALSECTSKGNTQEECFKFFNAAKTKSKETPEERTDKLKNKWLKENDNSKSARDYAKDYYTPYELKDAIKKWYDKPLHIQLNVMRDVNLKAKDFHVCQVNTAILDLPLKFRDLTTLHVCNHVTEHPDFAYLKGQVPDSYKAVGWNTKYEDVGGVFSKTTGNAAISTNTFSPYSTTTHECGHGVWEFDLTNNDHEAFEDLYYKHIEDLKNLNRMYEANDIHEFFAVNFSDMMGYDRSSGFKDVDAYFKRLKEDYDVKEPSKLPKADFTLRKKKEKVLEINFREGNNYVHDIRKLTEVPKDVREKLIAQGKARIKEMEAETDDA